MISTFKDMNIQNDFGNTLKTDYLQNQINTQLGNDLEVIVDGGIRYLALKSKNGDILSLVRFPANAIVIQSPDEIKLILNELNVGKAFIYTGETTEDLKYVKGSLYLIEEEEIED